MNPSQKCEMPRFAGVDGALTTLPLKPPFSFTNLTTRIFPLRASPVVVQSFCDNYMNVLPAEVGRFRAFTPYVQLMIMDYGALALEVTNLGWFAQREVMFAIPVEWYKVVDGKWVFHDWATIPAYIFVDDELSLAMGRTVVGWPKTRIRMTPTLSGAMHDPLGPVKVGTLSAMVFPELYAGERQEERVFLEFERDGPLSALSLPPDTQNPMMPWVVWSRMVDSAVGMGRDAMSWLSGLGLAPMHPGSSPDNYAAMMARAGEMTNPLQPDLGVNVVNLKQFRAADCPSEYCYQAATLGTTKFTRFNAVGVLGEQAMAGGDLSGGYTIKLHDWPSLPIIRSLGLEVSRRWRGDGVDVAEINPVFPFWYDCDMEYTLGHNLAWRSRDGIWHGHDGKDYVSDDPDTRYLYNTSLGPATKPIAGPFRFSDTTVRVLPLLARREQLQKFLDTFMNSQLSEQGEDAGQAELPAERFRVLGPTDEGAEFAYVYMTATSFGDVTSASNNVGDWASRELSYLVPVRRERLVEGAWTLIGVGVVSPFAYTDNVTASIGGREVLGLPTTAANFLDTESSWMSREGPATFAEQELLRVEGEVLPAVGEGEEAVQQPIAEVLSGVTPTESDAEFWRIAGDVWSHTLRHELERKKSAARTTYKVGKGKEEVRHVEAARALALEILGGRMPVSFYTLKQFRDNGDPDKACYQSLVRIERTLAEVLDMREIEEPLLVRMHDFPTRSLVRTLGLVGKPIKDSKHGIVYGLKPVRPFWMRVTVDEALGQELRYRAGELTWRTDRGDRGPGTSEETSYLDGNTPIGVAPMLASVLDAGDPRRMAKALLEWYHGHRPPDAEGADAESMTPDAVREVLGAVDPQTVIETILSREWGNWDPDNRWRKGRRESTEYYEMTLSGTQGCDVPEAEVAYLEQTLEDLRARPGSPFGITSDEEEVFRRLHAFSSLKRDLESEWSLVVTEGLRALAPKAKSIEEVVAEGGEEIGPERAVEALIRSLELAEAIGDLDIAGSPSSPEHEDEPAGQEENKARLRELIREVARPMIEELQSMSAEQAYQAMVRSGPTQLQTLRRVIALARARCALQLEATLNCIAKAYQKPDFCIRRDFAGPETERLFPSADSWDGVWYAGPDRVEEAEE